MSARGVVGRRGNQATQRLHATTVVPESQTPHQTEGPSVDQAQTPHPLSPSTHKAFARHRQGSFNASASLPWLVTTGTLWVYASSTMYTSQKAGTNYGMPVLLACKDSQKARSRAMSPPRSPVMGEGGGPSRRPGPEGGIGDRVVPRAAVAAVAGEAAGRDNRWCEAAPPLPVASLAPKLRPAPPLQLPPPGERRLVRPPRSDAARPREPRGGVDHGIIVATWLARNAQRRHHR